MLRGVNTKTMGALIKILKTTVAGGLVVLLPLLLLVLVIKEIFELIADLVTPIANLLPRYLLDKIDAPTVVAIVLTLGISFVLGLITYTKTGRWLGNWVERYTVGRLALYQVLRNISRRLIGAGGVEAFAPAILHSSDGQYEFVYLVEDLGDGWVTVMLPWAPTPLAGSIKIVRRDIIEMLDAPFGDLMRVLSNWGVGARELQSKRYPTSK